MKENKQYIDECSICGIFGCPQSCYMFKKIEKLKEVNNEKIQTKKQNN